MKRRLSCFLWATVLLSFREVRMEIHITDIVPPANGTVIKQGETTFLSCTTNKKWFFCVWKTPFGDKQCAIQESRPTNVCEGDDRIHLNAGPNNCDITIYNVSSQDTGTWMCLVLDGIDSDTQRAQVDIEVGLRAQTSLSIPRQLKQSTGVLRVEEGTQTEITCEAGRANPPAQFRWSGPRTRDALMSNTSEEKNDGGHAFMDNASGEKYIVGHGDMDNTSEDTVMSKYVGGELEADRNEGGNITIQEKAHHTRVGHHTNSYEKIIYHANRNDTNKTITCFISQSDKFGNVIYHAQQSLIIIVDKIEPAPPAPTTLSLTEQVGIVAGALLAIIFIILICVFFFIITCKRRKRKDLASSVNSTINEDKSDHELPGYFVYENGGPIWSTSSQPYLVGHSNEAYHNKHEEYLYGSDSVDNSEGSSGTESSPSRERGRIIETSKTVSNTSSNSSVQTGRSISKISAMFHSNLHTAPSLHETHFGISQTDLPLTILHPPSISFHPPGNNERERQNIMDPSMRKISSSHSDVIPGGLSIFQPIRSRPASSMALFGIDSHRPQRLSTPTCAGSKSSFSHSVFDCDHGCFDEKY